MNTRAAILTFMAHHGTREPVPGLLLTSIDGVQCVHQPAADWVWCSIDDGSNNYLRWRWAWTKKIGWRMVTGDMERQDVSIKC